MIELEKLNLKDCASLFLDSLPHYAFIKDMQGRYIYINTKCEEILPKEIFLGKTDFEIFPKELATQFYLHDKQVMIEQKEICHDELIFLGNAPEWIKTHKKPIFDSKQKMIGILGYSFNVITDKNETDRAYVMMKIFSSMSNDNKANFALFDYDVINDKFSWQYSFYELYEIDTSHVHYHGSMDDWMQSIHVEDRISVYHKIKAALADKNSYMLTFDFRILTPNEHIKYLWSKAQIRRDQNQQAVRIIGVNLDISETKQNEKALKTLSYRLEMVTRAGKIGLWSMNCQTMALEWDKQMFNLYGVPEVYPYVPRDTWIKTLHPYDRQTVLDAVSKALLNKKSFVFSMTYRIILPDSLEIKYIFVQARIERDEEGIPLQLIGVNIDITDTKKTEYQSRKLELVNQFAHIGNWDLNILTGELHWDERMFDLYGMDPKSFKHTNNEWINTLDPICREKILRDFSLYLNEKKPALFSTVIRVVRRDNQQKKCIQVYAEAQRDQDGRPLRVIGINIDITEREREKQLIIENQQLLKTLTETSPVGIFRTDAEGKMIFITGAWEKITFISIQQALHQYWYFFAISDDQKNIDDSWQTMRAQPQLMKIECRFAALMPEKEQIHWALIHIVPEYHHTDKVVGYTGTITDITERKNAEQSVLELNTTLEKRVASEVARNVQQERLLLQQSKLAAMGEMIGNIAHQWRQPLTALNIIISNLQDSYEYDEFNEALLINSVARSRSLIQKMSKTIDDFRNFFRPDKEKVQFSVDEQIQEMLSLLGAGFNTHAIEIRYTPIKQPVCIWGYPNEFSQAILNILSNAKDALVARKNVTPYIDIRFSLREQNISIIIKDNGGGIPTNILSKIFDPYFTTKAKGTGIGLYMTKVIIEQNMGGKIEINSIHDETIVKVTFPQSISGNISSSITL